MKISNIPWRKFNTKNSNYIDIGYGLLIFPTFSNEQEKLKDLIKDANNDGYYVETYTSDLSNGEFIACEIFFEHERDRLHFHLKWLT